LEKIIDRAVEVIKEVIVEKPVPYEVIKEIHVPTYIDRPVEVIV